MTSYNYCWQAGSRASPNANGGEEFPSYPMIQQQSGILNVQSSQHYSQYHPLHTAATISSHNPAVYTNFCLKIFNPANKRDFKTCTIRGISRDAVSTPKELKQALVEQYGDLLPDVDSIEVGYFIHSKKMWINN